METQGQQPIHFAAKYNAVDAFEALIHLGADPIVRDSQARTPFFVAAAAGFLQFLFSLCTKIAPQSRSNIR